MGLMGGSIRVDFLCIMIWKTSCRYFVMCCIETAHSGAIAEG